jgi:hypothetical protein
MIMQIFENDFFWFFVLPFFQKKHKIKQSRDQNDLFINDGKYMKQKPYTSLLSSRAGREDVFEKRKATNKHYLNKEQWKKRQQRPNYS